MMINRYIARNTSLQAETGQVKFEFTGTGGALFGTLLGGYLLTVITAGIYGPWFICGMLKFELEGITISDKE